MRNNVKFSKFRKPGFTLVETLMVMLILALVMVAVSSLASTVLRSAGQNTNRIKAIYLTQQCTELVRNVRDSAWRQNIEWTCPFSPPFENPVEYDPDNPLADDVYTISVREGNTPILNCKEDLGALVAPAEADLAWLYETSTPGILTSDPLQVVGTEPSNFRRYFTVDAFDATENILEVTCHTKWGDDEGHVKMTQLLTNWRRQ